MNVWENTYKKWSNYEHLDSFLNEQLIEMKTNIDSLKDAFGSELMLCEDGMRGKLGPGTNRVNLYTVRKVVKGLAVYLKKHLVNVKDRGVVIAYDSRSMPQTFALEAAKVLGAQNIKAYVFGKPCPAPLLVYAVRYLGTCAGVMMTASHDLSGDNGFKLYNEEGSQISLTETITINETINEVDNELNVPTLKIEELEKEHLIQWVNGEVQDAYLKQLLTLSKLNEKALNKQKDLQVVCSPLSDTVFSCIKSGLKQLNFKQTHVVEGTTETDFSSPNFEEAHVFSSAIQLGIEKNADILLATDSCANRLRVAVKNNEGSYITLTGNQIGSLLLDYILRHSGDTLNLKSARMLKTIATTELSRKIAQSYGVITIDTLIGFKHIGEKVNLFDTTGETFIFGFEESFGYLTGSFVRDQDAIQSAVMVCEMVHYWKEKGKTLFEVLSNLYEKHGFFKERVTTKTFESKGGKEKAVELMDYFRESRFEKIAGLHTKVIDDYLNNNRVYITENKTETIHFPKENIVKYKFADGSWMCIQSFGTESMIKFYFGVTSETEVKSDAKLLALNQAIEEVIEKEKVVIA